MLNCISAFVVGGGGSCWKVGAGAGGNKNSKNSLPVVDQ